MRILTVNRGSSSLKLRLIGAADEVEAAADPPTLDGLAGFLRTCGPLDAVAHRVVHGGERFVAPLVLDEATDRSLRALADLAPLHNAGSVEAIERAQWLRPDAVHVACFDTAFHATLPQEASTYAIPEEWRARLGLRRFGFHGLSHGWVSRRVAKLVGERPLRLVSAHVGAGASLSAIADGRPVDTTMGFTPLEGLVMATRSGSVDPGLVLWVLRHTGMSLEEMEESLERRSGLRGLAGTADLREVLAALDRGDGRAALAYGVYVHRLRREIAAMAASAGGMDALAFTGGAGEASPRLRADVVDGLGFLGCSLDPAANAASLEGPVSPPGAAVAVLVVHAREDLEMARQVRRLLGGTQPGDA